VPRYSRHQPSRPARPAPAAGPATPADSLAELLAGNRRFVTDTRIHPNQDAEHRAALAVAQRPFAVVFGCSDSRLAAEIIFDRGLGDLFVVRTAGHILGAEVLASIEYGVVTLGAPLVVVLGHDSCGAIQAAHTVLVDDEVPASDPRVIVDRVLPSIRLARARHLVRPDEVAEVHVERTVEMLVTQGGVAEAVAAARCAVVGMSYRLADGRVAVVTAGAPGAAAVPDTPAGTRTGCPESQ
jgi:carbonic anhydrase